MKKLLIHLYWCYFVFIAAAYSADIVIDTVHGANGDQVVFTMSVQNAPTDVNAAIMDVSYDTSSLSFVSCQRGDLATNGYPMFLVNEYEPGTVRIGAVDPYESGISKGDSGIFLTLTFDVTGEEDSRVRFIGLKDDLNTWNAGSGHFIYTGASQEETEGLSEQTQVDAEESISVDNIDESGTAFGSSVSNIKAETDPRVPELNGRTDKIPPESEGAVEIEAEKERIDDYTKISRSLDSQEAKAKSGQNQAVQGSSSLDGAKRGKKAAVPAPTVTLSGKNAHPTGSATSGVPESERGIQDFQKTSSNPSRYMNFAVLILQILQLGVLSAILGVQLIILKKMK